MEAIRVQQVVTKDGEIVVKDLPYKKGQHLTVLIEPVVSPPRPRLTVRQLRHSGLIGLWKNRTDIKDSAVYARQLREQAQTRPHLKTAQPYKKSQNPFTVGKG